MYSSAYLNFFKLRPFAKLFYGLSFCFTIVFLWFKLLSSYHVDVQLYCMNTEQLHAQILINV